MRFFDKWLYSKVRDMWENKHKYDSYEEERAIKMATVGAAQMISKGHPEGEDRISFELSTAIGGRILNVRRYDERKDRHEHQTYVIPNGEDLGQRVAKILNLEQYK
jgi:hypothetical protein